MIFNFCVALGLLWILRFGSILNKPRNLLTSIHPSIKELFNCSLCLGFWIGVLLSCTNLHYGKFSELEAIMFPFACSGVCWFIDSLLALIQFTSLKVEEK